MTADAPVIGVDLGGTRMRAAVVTPSGRILDRVVQPTPRDAPCPEALLALLAEVRTGTGATAAVIGVPGRVDYRAGRMEFAPNLPPTWAPSLAERPLSETLGLPVSLANDADLATVGEYRFGAGRGYGDMLYVTVSTGIGAGVILDGKLAHGRRSLAEAGHTIIDRLAAARGEPATLELLASGSALQAVAAGAGRSGPELVEAAAAGDAEALALWRIVAETAGFGVASLAHLFSPEVIVVGGGVGLTGVLIEPIRTALEQHGPRGLTQRIEVAVASLGDDAGLIGAAGWADTFVPGAGPDRAVQPVA